VSRKILMAVDGSEKGYEAVSIVGDFLKNHPDIEMTLFHCLPEVAGLLPGELFAGLEASVRTSVADQQKVSNAVFAECRRRLVDVGFSEHKINVRLKADSIDPAEDIQLEAGNEGIRSIALGRRGRSQLETLLLGSVSSKVALYSRHHSVWIVDTPVHKTRRVLVAMEGLPDARVLIDYLVEVLVPIPELQYHFLHLMPPVPPTFWDDGHILGPAEQQERQARVEKWRSVWKANVEQFMLEGRNSLKAGGVPERKRGTDNQIDQRGDCTGSAQRDYSQAIPVGRDGQEEL
jgi:nucleotide-binding universal stress UspA family protein